MAVRTTSIPLKPRIDRLERSFSVSRIVVTDDGKRDYRDASGTREMARRVRQMEKRNEA